MGPMLYCCPCSLQLLFSSCFANEAARQGVAVRMQLHLQCPLPPPPPPPPLCQCERLQSQLHHPYPASPPLHWVSHDSFLHVPIAHHHVTPPCMPPSSAPSSLSPPDPYSPHRLCLACHHPPISLITLPSSICPPPPSLGPSSKSPLILLISHQNGPPPRRSL